ncbi:phage protein GemA/Gp16 family protein [Actinobacillus capsulatus]|uniref:phage protein GemA/Gp16 family protein n=1 Tax=Actinobacillus capsulatus TaxID=717 RepID=UPI000374BDCA|nr:phage protein GemA/Gp16 family protein [Actinobacillus capsulatus]
MPNGTSALSALQRNLWAVWKTGVKESTSAALNAYVKRYYAEVDWCELDGEQTASIIEQLKQWKKRVGK